MIVFPLPLIFAAVIGFLLVQDLVNRSLRLFHALLALCALQSILIALGHHYGLPVHRALPVTACVLPPLAWLAFREALFAEVTPRQALPHAVSPLLAVILRLLAPELLDVLVPVVFAGYGLAILWARRSGSALPLARLDAGPVPARTWGALGLALLLSTLGDVLISVGFILGHPEWRGPVVSLVTSVSLLLIALLALGGEQEEPESTAATDGREPPELQGEPQRHVSDGATDTVTEAEDAALLVRLEDLMTRERPYLEPSLTLARLARRLRIPAKRLSAAINRTTGENVSRYVNGFRIRHACGLLEAGRPVTEVIYASGFNTKSNFNREFLRVTGRPPSAW